jgi:hypothetical protein
LTAIALLIHGYHPYAEDAEIYLPGILKILNPNLFPANAEFFGEHAGHSFYPNLIAFSVRASHLPLPWVAFLWQLACIFLMLVASLRMASALFHAKLPPTKLSGTQPDGERSEECARWGAAGLMAALLTLPVAGTELYILDQYLNPRSLAAFSVLFAVAEVLYHKYGRSALWLGFAASVHPLMASFGILFCGWLILLDRCRPRIVGFAMALPFGITFAPPPAAFHEVALRQPAFFVLRWHWYEWLGIIGPVIVFWWFGKWARRRGCANLGLANLGLTNLELVSKAMVPFVLVACAAAVGLGLSDRFEALARLQPLRCLALCYMVLVVVGGGLLGQYILRRHVWRWIAFFVPLSLGMYFAQLQLFPASAHVEWPWSQPRNQWAQAFDWIRENTPGDAFFAIDPRHMGLPGEDENGFRARSERSRLADFVKDKGACSMFPPLSVKWAEQIADQQNFERFGKEDFDRLRQKYGVTWVVVQQSSLAQHESTQNNSGGFKCPYENSTVRVCRID